MTVTEFEQRFLPTPEQERQEDWEDTVQGLWLIGAWLAWWLFLFGLIYLGVWLLWQHLLG